MNIAVILAAGQSRRTKKINKIFYKIGKKPLIFYTISTFEKHPEVKKIILVTQKSDFKKFSSLVKDHKFKKIEIIIEGGKKRQDSAFNGLKAAGALGAKPEDLILFHNGCNPLVSRQEITKTIKAAKKHKAALVAQPAKDTLKKVSQNGFVLKTINRKSVYLAQTPQVIEYTLAKEAFKRATQCKFYSTDDISLVEKLGKRVKVIPCSHKNIKVTTKEDLEMVKNLLKK